MATGDGWEAQFLAGLAQHLDDNSVGTWRPTGVYAADEKAITIRGIPPEPDQLITLSLYPVESVRGMQDITVGINIRIRGTTHPDDCSDTGDALFELLDSSGFQLWGDIRVVDVFRRGYASLGQDPLNRWEASHNYYAQAMRLTAHRTD